MTEHEQSMTQAAEQVELQPTEVDVAAEHQLRDLQGELNRQNRLQEAFAYGVSHDLRAPLRAITTFADLLDQHPGAQLDATGHEYLQRIHEAAARMSHLLDALHDLSLAGRATLRQEAVDLSLLADWVGMETRDRDPGRDASIEVAPNLVAWGDERFLKLMLAQLIDNAWRFTAPGDQVRISVDGERSGDRIHLHVRDQGIGFDMRYANKLFETFGRLHGSDEGAGNGVGLAIAQCIAQRHGGSIRAESTPGNGSIFHIELPTGQG